MERFIYYADSVYRPAMYKYLFFCIFSSLIAFFVALCTFLTECTQVTAQNSVGIIRTIFEVERP